MDVRRFQTSTSLSSWIRFQLIASTVSRVLTASAIISGVVLTSRVQCCGWFVVQPGGPREGDPPGQG
ncbi:hypothetical protein ACFFX0_33470 [Citricoccus parietis]|uniref:Uncharacterized protein n=1 Tax=Citricoccus parietis TaxID=592307 RepID=A0ABV5GA19_9MICC